MTAVRAPRGGIVPGLALAEVAALVPPPLAAFGDRVAAGPGGPTARPASTLRERAVFDAAIAAFGEPFGAADRRAVVSYWTQFYLAALVIPALTGLAHFGRALPLGLDEIDFELDEAGCLARFLVPEAPRIREGSSQNGLATLVEGHLRPFVELCHTHSGLARRVLWGNVAVIVDRTAEELAAVGAAAPALIETATLLGWRARRDASGTEGASVRQGAGPMPDCAAIAHGSRSPLADTLRAVGPDGGRCRRVCCLRYRLPGVADCGALCPAVRRPDTARTDRPC